MADADLPSGLRIAVAASLAPGETREWSLQLPLGSTVADALRACGLNPSDAAFSCGIWGRVTECSHPLQDLDRVEWCRALVVEPKVARRERFARQGARGAGLFADRRPGAKAGY
ncbi:MAG: RnfH family protein [Comamonadaceae bacterium]|nr:MAG: RnfH family protein [Comamonadaceae bacterium]